METWPKDLEQVRDMEWGQGPGTEPWHGDLNLGQTHGMRTWIWARIWGHGLVERTWDRNMVPVPDTGLKHT